MRLQRWTWPVIIVASALGTGLATFRDAAAARPALSLWFLLICPGMAFVRLLRLNDAIAQLTLAVALSLALDTIVAVAMLYAGLWSPKGILSVVIALSLLGAALQIDTMGGDAAVEGWK